MQFGRRGDKKSRLFRAMWDGECTKCGEETYQDEEVGYVEEEFVCKSCWDDA
jgi:formylmethanofuran dehydrogenase subunit E